MEDVIKDCNYDSFRERIVIKTVRLELVEFDIKYATDLYELWSDFEVIKYTYMPQLKSVEQCAEKIKMFINNTDKEIMNNFIILRNNKAIGIIGSPIIDKEHAMFGLYYQLARKYWGNGYISEAIQAFKEHIIKQFSDAKFEAEVVSENSASLAILRKYDFIEADTAKEGFMLNGFKLDLIKFHSEK